jgi:hypothetical protein
MPIPKIMHFIWVGKTIPDDRLHVIQQWHAQYPDFEIYIWTDPSGTDKSFGSAIREEQQEKLRTAGISQEKLKIKDIIEIASDERAIRSMRIIRYEIDRLRPNYGAASDLIRYEALYKYGGVYMDSDVLPPKKALYGWLDISLYSNQAFWENANRCFIYNVTVGAPNDVIFSPLGSEGILSLINHIQEDYNVKKQVILRRQEPTIRGLVGFQQNPEANSCIQAYNYSTNTYIKYSTLKRTGPFHVSRIYLYDNEMQEIMDIKDLPRNVGWIMSGIEFPWKIFGKIPTGTQESQIRVPLEDSGKSWLGLAPKRINEPQVAVDIVMESIIFELEHFGILRLSDHLSDVEDVFKLEPVKKEFCFKRLIEWLSTIILDSKIVVQYPLVNEEHVRKLLEQKSWLENTCLYPLISLQDDPNRAIISALRYFQQDIEEIVKEITERSRQEEDLSKLLTAFSRCSEITLKFVNCLFVAVNIQKNVEVIREILSEAKLLVNYIKENIQTLMPLQLQPILAKAEQSLITFSRIEEKGLLIVLQQGSGLEERLKGLLAPFSLPQGGNVELGQLPPPSIITQAEDIARISPKSADTTTTTANINEGKLNQDFSDNKGQAQTLSIEEKLNNISGSFPPCTALGFGLNQSQQALTFQANYQAGICPTLNEKASVNSGEKFVEFSVQTDSVQADKLIEKLKEKDIKEIDVTKVSRAGFFIVEVTSYNKESIKYVKDIFEQDKRENVLRKNQKPQ